MMAYSEVLSEEDRQIILECARESAELERALWTQREKEAKKQAVEEGTQVIELSGEEKERFREAVSAVYEKYAGDSMNIVEEIKNAGK